MSIVNKILKEAEDDFFKPRGIDKREQENQRKMDEEWAYIKRYATYVLCLSKETVTLWTKLLDNCGYKYQVIPFKTAPEALKVYSRVIFTGRNKREEYIGLDENTLDLYINDMFSQTVSDKQRVLILEQNYGVVWGSSETE